MSNDLVEVGANAPAQSSFGLVDVKSAKAFMDNYQAVCKSLLTSTDYQKVPGMPKPFKKKTAWRKIATAFNISDEVIKEIIIRDDCYRIISATFFVRATAPNGRSGVGVASCSIFDKITKRDKEEPTPFELRKRFNNADNDVITIAHTRAKSRAISDLVGMGETSAEEMEGFEAEPKRTVSVKAKPKVKPKTKPKKEEAPKEEPAKDKEAIDVEVVSGDKPSKSLKDLADESKIIKRAIDELQEENRIINRDAVKDRLLSMMQAGAIKEEEYKEAKELM